ERVRAQLGRLVSHPGAITVTAHAGDVTLSGQILAAEHQTLLSAVRAMAGVNRVDDRLQAHESPGNIPELQGGSPSCGRRVRPASPLLPCARLPRAAGHGGLTCAPPGAVAGIRALARSQTPEPTPAGASP